jgi:hypothetical protein
MTVTISVNNLLSIDFANTVRSIGGGDELRTSHPFQSLDTRGTVRDDKQLSTIICMP